MTTECKHHEVIDAHGLGTCQYCGQERQYNQENQLQPPVIVKKGDPNRVISSPDTPRQAPMGKLTAQERLELLEVGPKAFCKRHGYREKGAGRSAITGTYNTLKAKKDGRIQGSVIAKKEIQAAEMANIKKRLSAIEGVLAGEHRMEDISRAPEPRYLKATIEATQDIPYVLSRIREIIDMCKGKDVRVDLITKINEEAHD